MTGPSAASAEYVQPRLPELGHDLTVTGVAMLLSRRHRATSPVAAATAAILCMDAWFDTMSAAPQLPYAESLAMACFAELPLAALLAWTAWRTLEWAAPRGPLSSSSALPLRKDQE